MVTPITYLHAEDHDNEYDYGPGFEEPSVKTYIESNDDGTSSVEFSFGSWDLRDAANYLKEGESSITYSLENINANFETLGGYYNADLSKIGLISLAKVSLLLH